MDVYWHAVITYGTRPEASFLQPNHSHADIQSYLTATSVILLIYRKKSCPTWYSQGDLCLIVTHMNQGTLCECLYLGKNKTQRFRSSA